MKNSCTGLSFALALMMIIALIVPSIYAQGNPPRLIPYTITTVAGGATPPVAGVTDYFGGSVCGMAWPTDGSHAGAGPTWATPPYDIFGDGCLATQASLNAARYADPDPYGTLWILDTGDGVVRTVNPLTGIITQVPNTYLVDGSPRGAAFDLAGNYYFIGESKSKGWFVDYITGTVSRFVGPSSGGSGCAGDGGPATSAQIRNPSTGAEDLLGNTYIIDSRCYVVRKIDRNMNITTVLGKTGVSGCTASNPATLLLTTPYSVATDPMGNLYVSDTSCDRVIKVLVDPATIANGVGYVTANSVSLVIAGVTLQSPTGYTYPFTCFENGPCGPATSTPISPTGLQVDPEGPVADSNGQLGYNLYIQQYTHVWYYDFATKWLHRIAGDAHAASGSTLATYCAWSSDNSGDNCPEFKAVLQGSYGVDVDNLGNLYIGEAGENLIRKVWKGTQMTDGSVSTLPYVSAYMPQPQAPYEGTGVIQVHYAANDGPAASNPFQVLGNFSLLSTVLEANSTVVPSPNCVQSTNGDNGWDCEVTVDFKATAAGNVAIPLTITATAAGSKAVYPLSGAVNRPAVALDPGMATVLTGSVSNPSSVAVDGLGNWYVADTGNNRILKNGTVLVSGLNAPQGVAVDGPGNVYFSDTGNNRVNKWNARDGSISQVAGGGVPCNNPGWNFSSDAVGNNCLARQASLNHPTALAVDAMQNLYILDQGNAEIRRVDPKLKTITLVAGGGGNATFYPECAANPSHPRCVTLDTPVAMALRAPGMVYVAEGGSSNDIKLINLLAFPATITPVTGYSPITSLTGLGVDAAGDLYYSDAGGQVVVMINAQGASISVGSNQLVLGVLGTTGNRALDANPLANSVALNGPGALALDPFGNVYVADVHNNRILKVDRTQSAIAFGNVNAASPVLSSAINVTNIGTTSLSVQSLKIPCPACVPLPALVFPGLQPTQPVVEPSDSFTATGTCDSATLAAGTSCQVQVQAHPATSGDITGAIVIESNALNAPVIAVSAFGIGPAASLSSTSISFPNSIMVGQSSPAQYVSIKSLGSAPLSVTSVSLGGLDPRSFLISNQAGSCVGATSAAPTVLAYNTSCNIRVVFAPRTTGLHSATLFIYDYVLGFQQTVSLSGTAISGALLTQNTAALTFATTKVGATAPAQYITLKSTGYQPVVISKVTLNSADFDLTDQAGTCSTAASTTLVPGASCNIRVRFHPTATGPISATVTINDNTDASPHTVTLNGTGN